MNLLKIIIVLIAIESGGDDSARGSKGEIGCLQIKRIVVDDINRNILKRNHFTYADRYDRAKSIEMCQLYLAHYGTRERIGRAVTEQDLVRIWKGGPDGWHEADTLEYWQRYKAERSRQSR